jgi:hypothetical protein
MSVNVGSAYATFELNIKSFLDAIKTANAHLDRAMQTMAHAERTAAQTGPGIGKAFEIVATALRRTSDEAQQAGRSVTRRSTIVWGAGATGRAKWQVNQYP